MNIFDHLKIKFETPLWGLIPELAVIDTILEGSFVYYLHYNKNHMELQ